MVQKDKTPLHLRLLCMQSYLAMFAAILLPVTAKLMGKDTTGRFLPFLLAGLIGISAYETSSRLHKRVTALENQTAMQKTDSD
jgi:hypothetical protein